MHLVRLIWLKPALWVLLLVVLACTADADRQLSDVERTAHRLNQTIMCPVCPGESIDQSQNPLAVQMRGIVEQKLTDGWSEGQIKQFFVERYGPSVLLEPPTTGFSMAAWIVPPFAFGMAVVALLLTLRWMRLASREPESGQTSRSQPDSYAQRIDEALGSADIGESSRRRDQSRGRSNP